MNKKELLSYIKSKDIILFGAGDFARRFYLDFRDEINIRGCISNNRLEKQFVVNNTEICRVEGVAQFSLKPNQFIITCSADSESMQQQLADMGYTLGKDYLNSSIYRIIASHKPIALFYGVCYMRAIKECLDTSSVFSKRYESINYLDYVNYGLLERQLLYLILEICDLFIYTSYLSPQLLKRLDGFYRRLNHDCSKICVPFITFSGYHPRKNGMPMDSNPFSVTSAKAPYAPFSAVDENILGMITEGAVVNEIIKKIKDPDFYTEDFLRDNFEKELRRIKVTERFSDIRISSYINENYDRKKLFLNESHISNEIIIEISKQILRKLELPVQLNEQSVRDKMLLYTSEVPVYPSVIRHLGLKQYNSSTTYKLFTYNGQRKVTFDEYVSLYIEYSMDMKKHIERGFFPK